MPLNPQNPVEAASILPKGALEVCERLVFGQELTQIERIEGFPTKNEFLKWVMQNPAVAQLFKTAREVSAFSLEEEAIDVLRELTLNPGTAQHVRAVGLLVEQLRWSATRRNPSTFSERVATNIVVPIHISTSLDLGDTLGGGGTSDFPNIYEMSAENVIEVPVAELTDADLNAISPPSAPGGGRPPPRIGSPQGRGDTEEGGQAQAEAGEDAESSRAPFRRRKEKQPRAARKAKASRSKGAAALPSKDTLGATEGRDLRLEGEEL